MDEDDLFDLEDLIDDSIVAAPGRVQSFELSEQRFSEALWILDDGTENRCECCFPQLFGEAVQVSKTLELMSAPIGDLVQAEIRRRALGY